MNVKHLTCSGVIVLCLIFGLWLAPAVTAQSVYEDYTFVTFAGPGEAGAGWFDGIGSAARFSTPGSIARDASGNLYVADSGNNTIRKITTDGQVTTLAGLNGVSGATDGVGAGAAFKAPFGVAVDGSGNVYVADTGNSTIRKISPSGAVTTLAGLAGVRGAVNGNGSAARFNGPNGIALDSSNNLYVADTGNQIIRKITPDGGVTTLAGSAGKSGSADKTGTAASFNSPIGVAVDQGGNVYVADAGNDTIRKITSAGVVSTLAGLALNPGIADGTNQTARFTNPSNLAIDSNNNLYVADTFNLTIRKVTPNGVVTTLAGTAEVSGSVDGIGTDARFDFPVGIVVDDNTNLFVSDFGNDSIRKITAGLAVTTFAGVSGGSGSHDATGSAARFNFPSDLAFDSTGNAYITDLGNNTIRKMTSDGTVTTLAGLATVSGTNDGIGGAARFFNPEGLAVDPNGNIFVADTANDTIRKIDPAGSVTTFAGTGGAVGAHDDVGAAATFNSPLAVTFDKNGNLLVGDTHNEIIRKISPDRTVTTVAGIAGSAGTNDGPALTAQFNFPEGVVFDANDNLYVVDDNNSTVRKIAPDGSVTTFAGNPEVRGGTDGTGTAALFSLPFGVAMDVSGNLYVGDTGNNTVRKITPAGVVTTIGGVAGQSGSLDGTGSDAQFNGPEGLAVDSQGNVYVADAGNHSIRRGYPALPDRPTVDQAIAQVGVTRHFSISNLTTTSWSWSIVRRPSGSLAELSATNITNPTFTPDVEDVYVVQFQGWDNSGHTTIRRLKLIADNTAPSLTITNPISGQTLSNGVITVRGTAADNFGLSNIWVQANSGAWTKATGTANWSADVNLTPGTNVIRAYAEDFAGNVSPTNEVGVSYVVSAPLTVQINGGGTVTPNFNGVLLEIGKTYSMTAQPGAGSAFVNWTGDLTTTDTTLTFVMQSNLTFVANFTDTIRPTLTIVSPAKSGHVSNAVFTATGTATDNGQLAAVWYQLNGGGWTQATNTANWTAGLALSQSANTLQAYAVDTFNNFSTTNSVAFTYIPSSQIKVLTTGNGICTPNYDGFTLQLGKTYTMTAKAGFNYLFSHWVDSSGNTLTTAPALKFVVQSNTTFRAIFTVNQYPLLIGPFAGLFYDTNNISVASAGFFSASLTDVGGFSGKLQLASGQNVSVSGRFTPEGVFSNSIALKGSAPLVVQLFVDSVNGGRITGSISGAGWTAPLLAYRAFFSPLNRAPQGNQKYTLVIPGGDDSTVQPGGNGYATISASAAGDLTISGVLGDGAKATQKTFVSKIGQWPFYVAPYKGQGVIFGWMMFTTNDPNSDLHGSLNWFRLPQSTAKTYPSGFNFANGIQAVGSVFSFTNGAPLLNLPSGGAVILQQGNPVQSFTNNFTLGSDNKVTSADGLSMTITTASGLFKGNAHNPGDGSSVPISGVLLQKQNAAYGLFLGTGQSGAVYFGP